MDVYLPPNPTIADMPPILLPPITNGVPLDGNAVAIFSDSHVWVTKTFISTPNWVEVTPDNLLGTVRDIRKVTYGLYVLGSDDTDSRLYYCENVFAANPAWVVTDITGIYTAIRVGSTTGVVYLEGYISGGGSTTVLDLYATEADYDTGISLAISDNVDISAVGTWCYGIGPSGCTDADGEPGSFNPTAQMPAEFLNSLIAHVDVGGAWFKVGVSFSFTAVANGNLYLGQNDSAHIDNSGFQRVTINVNGGSVSGIQSVYSDDFGVTFATPELIDVNGGGFDTVKVGTVALAGGVGQVYKVTSGGAWAAYGDPLPDVAAIPTAIFAPFYKFGSTTVKNSSTNPEYLVAFSVLDSDTASLYKVTSSGTVFTDITPVVSGDEGLAIDPDCIWMPWYSGAVIFAVLSFGGSPRLVVSANSGSTWSDKGILDDDANMVVSRLSDKLARQTYISNGNPAYSPNRGTSIISKSYPESQSTEPVLGIQVYG